MVAAAIRPIKNLWCLRAVALVNDALPDGCRRAGIIVGMRDVLERKRIRLLFLRLRDALVVPSVRREIAENRAARRYREHCWADGALRADGWMILLSMPHLVAEHDSDLIVVREHIKESRIHAHIVSERAERVEGLFIVDEIKIRLVVDGRVDRSNRACEVRHDAIETRVERIVSIDAVLILDLLQKFLPTFLRVIVILDLLVDLRRVDRAAEQRTDYIARAKQPRVRHRHRRVRKRAGKQHGAGGQRRRDLLFSFLERHTGSLPETHPILFFYSKSFSLIYKVSPTIFRNLRAGESLMHSALLQLPSISGPAPALSDSCFRGIIEKEKTWRCLPCKSRKS